MNDLQLAIDAILESDLIFIHLAAAIEVERKTLIGISSPLSIIGKGSNIKGCI